MDSRSNQIIELLNEINRLLDNHSGSLVPLVTKAARLANLCDDTEHKLLFEIHVDGLDNNNPSGGRFQKWPDKNRKPKWDVVEAFCSDRRTLERQTQGHSLQKLEYMRNSIKYIGK
jgi:hypothetical protein